MSGKSIFWLAAMATLFVFANAHRVRADQWKKISCAETHFSVQGSVGTIDCRAGPPDIQFGGRCYLQQTSQLGRNEGGYFFVFYKRTDVVTCAIRDGGQGALVEWLTAINKGYATGWGEAGRFERGYAVDFTPGTYSCFGFEQFGPQQNQGYAYFIAGHFCNKVGKPIDDEAKKALIATVELAP